MMIDVLMAQELARQFRQEILRTGLRDPYAVAEETLGRMRLADTDDGREILSEFRRSDGMVAPPRDNTMFASFERAVAWRTAPVPQEMHV